MESGEVTQKSGLLACVWFGITLSSCHGKLAIELYHALDKHVSDAILALLNAWDLSDIGRTYNGERNSALLQCLKYWLRLRDTQSW